MKAQIEDTNVLGVAFWEYDLYPYLLSAQFISIKEDKVYCPSYGGYFKPLFILDVEQGSKLAVEINNLRFKRQEELTNLEDKYYKELRTVVEKFGGRLK